MAPMLRVLAPVWQFPRLAMIRRLAALGDSKADMHMDLSDRTKIRLSMTVAGAIAAVILVAAYYGL